MEKSTKKSYNLDATGKKLGRLATEAAVLLLGKNSPGFQKHIISGGQVIITNASKMDITDKKATNKTYGDYSGYPGGLKKLTLSQVAARGGYKAVLERAIAGMIHNTKMKKTILKNLTITE